MCRAITCRVCGKTTWAGCGDHIQTIKRTVPASQWCNGKHTQSEINESKSSQGGFFARLFGR